MRFVTRGLCPRRNVAVLRRYEDHYITITISTSVIAHAAEVWYHKTCVNVKACGRLDGHFARVFG
jgi:hypothetical protein